MAGENSSEVSSDNSGFVHNGEDVNDAQDSNRNAGEAIAKAQDALPSANNFKLPTNETSQRIAGKITTEDVVVEPSRGDPDYVQRTVPRKLDMKMNLRAKISLGNDWKEKYFGEKPSKEDK